MCILGSRFFVCHWIPARDQSPQTSSQRRIHRPMLPGSSRPMLPGPYVVVLEFSRSPRAFREALLELDAVWELDSGVKVLVFPEHREAVKEAIRQASPMLRHQHVVVDPEFEAFVIDHLRQSLPGREKVRVKRRGTMALGPVDPRASGDDAQILDASDQ